MKRVLANSAENVAVGLAVSAPVAAAWARGGARASDHFWIFTPVILAGFVSLIAPSRRAWRMDRSRVERVVLVASFALVGVVMFAQSCSVFSGGVDSLTTSALGSAVGAADSPDACPAYRPLTVDRAATQSRFVQYVGVLFALLAGWRLLGARDRRQIVLMMVLLNGALVSLSGILQRQAPLTGQEIGVWGSAFGRDRFGPFVNRNNATLFLHLSCAAALGLRTPRTMCAAQRSLGWLTRAALVTVLAGITGSGSISGIAAIIMGVGALVSFGGDHRRRMLTNVHLIAVTLAVGLTYLRIVRHTMTRALTGSAVVASFQVRWHHWSDTAPAIRDFPVFGTGAGTYALVNPPFQRHAAFGHFANADNLAFETLVELGGIGLAACAVGATSFLVIVLRLVRARGTPEAQRMGLMGLWVFTSICTNSAADFGLLLPANAILAALLAGCVLAFVNDGDAASRDAERHSGWMGSGFGPLGWMARWSRLTGGAAVVALLPWGPIALREMAIYGECNRALTAVQQLCTPVVRDDLSAARARLGRVQAKRPNDARLLKAMAELHMLAFRHELVGQLAHTPTFASVDADELWNLTAPGRLAPLVRSHPSGAAASVLHGIVLEPKMQLLLEEADRLLNEAMRRSPFLPNAELEIAQVKALRYESTPVVAAVRRAVALQPAEFRVLHQAALLAAALNDRALFSTCVRQVLGVFSGDDEKRGLACALASAAFPNDCRWLIGTFHDHPDELMLLTGVASEECRNLLLDAASSVLQHQLAINPDNAAAHARRARLHRLQGSPRLQIQHLRTALRLQPRQIDWRLELAEALIAGGRCDEALDELAIAERLCVMNTVAITGQIRTLRSRCADRSPAPSESGAVCP